MIPARDPNATPFVAAPGDEANVQPLPAVAKIVTLADGSQARVIESRWTPMPDELERLNAGANVVLLVLSAILPPVMLEVGEAPE